MPKTRDDFQLDSGLASDFDGTIVEVVFQEPSSDYQRVSKSKDPVLTLLIESPDFERPIEQGYSIGSAKQWDAVKDGHEVVSGRNPDSHTFNMNSRAGVLVERMLNLTGEGDREKGIDFFIKRDAWMTQSSFYKGLTFHWTREKMKTMPDDQGNVKEVDVLLPSIYLGESKTETKASAGAASASGNGDLDKVLAGLTSDKDGNSLGLDEKGLRLAAAKNTTLKANPKYLREVINGPKIKELEDTGEIVRVDGKFV